MLSPVAQTFSASPELSIQYADFTARQREWLQGRNPGISNPYWKKQLGGDPPLFCNCPLSDLVRPIQTYRVHSNF